MEKIQHERKRKSMVVVIFPLVIRKEFDFNFGERQEEIRIKNNILIN